MSDPVQKLMVTFGCQTDEELGLLVDQSGHAVRKWKYQRRIPAIREREFKELARARGRRLTDEDFCWPVASGTRDGAAA